MKRLEALMREGWIVEYAPLYPNKNGGNAYGYCEHRTATITIDPCTHEDEKNMWDTFIHEYLHAVHPAWDERHDLIAEGVKKAMRQDGRSWERMVTMENALPQLSYLVKKRKFKIVLSDHIKGPGKRRHSSTKKRKKPAKVSYYTRTIFLNPLLFKTEEDLVVAFLTCYAEIRYFRKKRTNIKAQRMAANIVGRIKSGLP